MKNGLAILAWLLLCCVFPAVSTNPPVEIESPEIDSIGRISKSEIISEKKLLVNRNDCRVLSFSLTCTNDQLRSQTYHSHSANFTASMIQEVQNSPLCERFQISNLLVKTLHDTTEVPPITFFLKK